MKKKIVIMVAMVLLVACIAVTLASCSRDKNNENQVNVSVGASVKKILEADFAGYEAQNGWEHIYVNLTTKDYDYVTTTTGFDINLKYDYQKVSEYYCRNGQLFSNLYRINNYQGDEYNVKPIIYDHGIDIEFDDRRTCMDIEAAKIGLAMMLSAYENDTRNHSNSANIPENGIWTEDLVIYSTAYGFYDSDVMDMNFLEGLHNVDYFKYATAPITQEQFVQLLTALTLTDEDCADIADLILKSGELKEGQSAYDYLMGAFDVMFADVNKNYVDYVRDDLIPKYLYYVSFPEDARSWMYCQSFFGEILDKFYTGVFRLVTGEFECNIDHGQGYTFKFNSTGDLVGLKSEYNGGIIGLDLTFSDTPIALKDINAKTMVYIVPNDDDEDMVTAYVGTVEDFATKPIEDIKHSSLMSYENFKDLYTDMIGYDTLPKSPVEDYVIYYDDGSAQYVDEVESVLVKGDEIMHYTPNGEYYFRLENDEWWGYRKIITTNDQVWKKVKLDKAPEMYTCDPFALFASIVYDETSLDAQSYYETFVGKNNGYEFECDGYKLRLTADFEIYFENEDGETIEIWYESASDYRGTSASRLSEFNPIFRDVSNAVESNAKPSKPTFDAALKASVEAKSVTYRTVETWGHESSPYRFDFENNVAESYGIYYIFENGTMYEYTRYSSAYNGDYIKIESDRTYDQAFEYPVKALEGYTYDDIGYDPFNEVFEITIDNVKYTFSIANGYIDQMIVTKGSSNKTTYKFSDVGTTTITLPAIRLLNEELTAALKKTFEASSYTATRRFESGLTVVEQFDHKNQLASAKWTNKNDEEMLNILRAVAEDKVWMYSNASGQWIRAELDFEPDSYIDSVSELMSFKRDVESRYQSGEYTFDWDSEKDAYTFKNANFDCVISFKDGYLATLGVKSGADTVLEFSNYNEVSLALPTLGQVDEDARTAFKQAVENSSKANSFRMEFETIVEDMPLTFETDVVKGVKSLTTEYVMTATTPEEYQSGNFKRVDMAQIYREWSNNYTTAWSRTVTATSTGQMTLGNWSSGARTSAPEETHKADMWFYNFADSMTAGDLPIDALFALSKYDKATGEYIVYGYDLADMHIVEYRFKVQGGYISEVTISDKALLESMGVQSESLKIRYSKYDEITLDRPQGVN